MVNCNFQNALKLSPKLKQSVPPKNQYRGDWYIWAVWANCSRGAGFRGTRSAVMGKNGVSKRPKLLFGGYILGQCLPIEGVARVSAILAKISYFQNSMDFGDITGQLSGA